MLESNIPIGVPFPNFALCFFRDFILCWRNRACASPKPRNISLKSSGQIAFRKFVASLAESSVGRLSERGHFVTSEATMIMRRCFSTSVKSLIHENPLV